MENTVTITIDAYTELVKDAFRFEMLKEHLSKCESWQIEEVLNRFEIIIKRKETSGNE